MVGRALAILLVEENAARRAEDDLFQRVGEVGHVDLVVAAARGEQRGLISQVGQIGAHHPGRGGGQRVEVDVVG